MFRQSQALTVLLHDRETRMLARNQLLQLARDRSPLLEQLAASRDPLAARCAREARLQADSEEAGADLEMFCRFAGDVFDIGQAAWMLARAIDPAHPVAPAENLLNNWGSEFLNAAPCCSSNVERVQALSSFVFDKLGFQGNSACYYCEENSLLPNVVESRRGIPISLTLVAVLIAARAGMKVDGVNLPGHFIARHGDVFFDPFHGGRILEPGDIRSVVAKQGLEFRPAMLMPASPRQFFLRMMANLLYVHDLDGEIDKRDRVKNWMDALSACLVAG
jgi:hypothetical protein